jgi:hypothetical protein
MVFNIPDGDGTSGRFRRTRKADGTIQIKNIRGAVIWVRAPLPLVRIITTRSNCSLSTPLIDRSCNSR